jgi:hypothetical protein
MGDYIDFYIQEFEDTDLSRNLSYQLYYTNRNAEGFDSVAFSLSNLEALKALYPDLPLSEFNKLAPLPANYTARLASEFPGSYIAAFTSSWDILTHRSIRSNPEDITPEELGEKVGDFLSAFHKVNPEADLWESISAWSADVPTSKMSWLARRKIKETYSSFEHLVRPRFSSEGELKEWDNVKLFKGFAELPESMLLKQADKETSLKSSDSAVKKSLSTVSDLEATTLPKAPGMPSTLRAPDSSSLSDLSKATSLVDWVKDRYGEIATNFDTFFTMPALMDRSFEPLQDFITSLVDFQDAVSQGNVDGALALRKAEAARVLLEAAVSKATALGALALVNRSDGSAVLSKLATAAKTREMASSGTTPEERASFESKLEEQLASLADTLGGPRELSERLAIASAPHEPDATEEPEEAAEAPRRRFMRAPVRDSSSKVPGF